MGIALDMLVSCCRMGMALRGPHLFGHHGMKHLARVATAGWGQHWL